MITLSKSAAQCIVAAKHTMSKDVTRYHLQMVYVDREGNIVSTDGHILSHFKVQDTFPQDMYFDAVRIKYIEAQLQGEMSEIKSTFETDIKYPNWRQFIDYKTVDTRKLGLDLRLVEKAHKALKCVITTKDHGVRFNLCGPEKPLILTVDEHKLVDGLLSAQCIIMPMRI